MQPMERIPLGEWQPDQPSYPTQAAQLAKNCVPQARTYREFRGLTTTTDAATGGIVGATSIRLSSGAIRIVVGTPTTLLLLNGASWTTLGSGYSSVARWEFAKFGDALIAVAAGETPQYIDLSAGSPSAANLSGSPPNASHIGVVSDFVVLGNLDSEERTIQWSGYNNETIWDANGNPQYQADSQRLYSGGRVQRIIGGPYGYIFQDDEIRRMDYAGPPVIFSITPITRERGTRAPDSVTTAGDTVFFYAQDGFFALRGNQFTPIGEERVNRWFLDECPSNEIANMRGAVDRRNRIVAWSFASVAGGDHDRVLLYNYSVNRWSYAETTVSHIVELQSTGFNLDELTTSLGLADIDSESIPVESQAYLGGTLALFAADTSGKLGAFDGDALTAAIDTAEFDGGSNRRRSISMIRPIVEGSAGTAVTVQLGKRDSLTSQPSFGSTRSLNSVGEAPILSDARYHRVRLNISGGFKHATAVDVMSRSSGRF